MPKLSMSVPHTLGQEKAVERLKGQFSSIKDAYAEHVSDLQQEWDDNVLTFRFKTFGASIAGNVTAEPSEVKVTADLPLMAAMFKGTIEQRIREQLEQILA